MNIWTPKKYPDNMYWILKSCKSCRVRENDDDDSGERVIEPICVEKVGYDTFDKAYALHQKFGKKGLRIHGRRMNDEVELFEGPDGNETPGLREALLAKGLSVSMYEPSQETKRTFIRIKHTTKEKKPLPPTTPEEKRTQALKNAIASEEQEKKTKIDFAVLADAGKAQKIMLIAKFRAKEFYEFYADAGAAQTLSSCGSHYRVVGCVEGGEPRFKDTEDLAVFFKERGAGSSYKVDVSFCDMAVEQEREELEAKNKEKKAAKKHRRQQTASTWTTPSEQSRPTTESEEAIKARQREKAKEKKKAQRAKKKAQSAAVFANGRRDDIDDSGSTTESGECAVTENGTKVRIVGTVGTSFLVLENERGLTRIGEKREFVDLSALNEKDPAKRRLDHDESSSGGTLDDSDDEVEVVHATTTQDIHRLVENAEGRVFFAEKEKEKEDEETQRFDPQGLLASWRGF